jgi:hypothetical protein
MNLAALPEMSMEGAWPHSAKGGIYDLERGVDLL